MSGPLLSSGDAQHCNSPDCAGLGGAVVQSQGREQRRVWTRRFPDAARIRAWTARRTPNPGLILRTERQRDVRSRSRSGRCSIAARGLLANAGDTREGRRRRGTSKGREEAAPGWGTSPTPLASGLGRHPSPAGSYTEHRSRIRHARVGLRSGWRPIQTSRIWDAWARRGKRRSSVGLDKEIPNAALHMGLRPQGERSNPG